MDVMLNSTPEPIDRNIPIGSRVRVVGVYAGFRYPSHMGLRGVIVGSLSLRGAYHQWRVLLDGRKNGRYFFADELQILKE